jgi:RimJ/RimL family protein N-acetyltransferase
MFKGKHVQLRGLELTDVEIMDQKYNQLSVRRFMDHPFPISLEEMEEWVKGTWKARKDHKHHFFAIEHIETQQLIGVCGLMDIAKVNRKAELMIVIYENRFQEKGYGTEALYLILEFGFNQLNLHRIMLFTHDINTRAQRVYEKIGFKPGGRRRQASFLEGSYRDLLLYDLLASEYNG